MEMSPGKGDGTGNAEEKDESGKQRKESKNIKKNMVTRRCQCHESRLPHQWVNNAKMNEETANWESEKMTTSNCQNCIF
jgi:hypothetical protein